MWYFKIALLLEKQLNIYIYYLFVSQPLPVESPAAATELERVTEKQRERVCVLKLRSDRVRPCGVWRVALSRYSGHSPPFTLIERINQPITVTHTLTWPLYWPLIGKCDPVQASDWLIVIHSASLVLSGLYQWSSFSSQGQIINRKVQETYLCHIAKWAIMLNLFLNYIELHL